ncbi:MAG: hemerythrin domain-containing protein [Gammaproteobacteria bacterium]|nr:hemerythrin domain-containing protein [Gammaproteobacteria bacterium]
MKIVEQLRTDHENVATLLDILDDQVEMVRKAQSADYDLMRDIMYYMTTYPDGFHHPMEDAVIEKLVDRDPGNRDMALRVVKEHNDLARKSQSFLDMLLMVVDGEIVLRKDIVARGVDYIQFLRSHMQREEQRLFPLAESVLSEKDWKEISETIEHRRDPVFGEIVDAQFRSIYQFITLQSKD